MADRPVASQAEAVAKTCSLLVFEAQIFTTLCICDSKCACHAACCYRTGRQPDPNKHSYDAFLYAFLIDISYNASPLAFLNATYAPFRYVLFQSCCILQLKQKQKVLEHVVNLTAVCTFC